MWYFEFFGKQTLKIIYSFLIIRTFSFCWEVIKIKKKGKSISDKYSNLSHNDLLKFYSNEKHVEVNINGEKYTLAASFAIKPKGDGNIIDQKIGVNIIEDKYKISSALDAYCEPVLFDALQDKRLFDGKVVRLKSIESKSEKCYVTLQKASYFDSISTNFSMDHKPKNRQQTLREKVHYGGKLGPFSDSMLVNHIGVVFIIESSDGMIVTQKRSKQVANRPNTISSSVSGTFEWLDAETAYQQNSFIDGVLKGAKRESVDELAIIPDENLFFLGALRDYIRGGMPDFYFYAKSSKSLSQIVKNHKNAEEKWESDRIIGFEFHSNQIIENDENSIMKFHHRVHSILKNTKYDANLTFKAGLLLTANNILNRIK